MAVLSLNVDLSVICCLDEDVRKRMRRGEEGQLKYERRGSEGDYWVGKCICIGSGSGSGIGRSRQAHTHCPRISSRRRGGSELAMA